MNQGKLLPGPVWGQETQK